jgi:uncharacterized membrane protein YfcA
MAPEPSLLVLACIGLAAGLISGLLGIGGGIIIVPALVYLAGFSQLTATGTSLAILLPPVGLAAVWVYHRNGNVDLRAAVCIAVCMFLTAWVGSRIAQKMATAHLRLLFGVFITAVGVYMIVSSLKKM